MLRRIRDAFSRRGEEGEERIPQGTQEIDTPSEEHQTPAPSRLTEGGEEEEVPKIDNFPSRPKLTFGVEFEFYLAYKTNHPDPDPQDPRQIYGIVDGLSEFEEERDEAYEHMTSTLINVGLPAWSEGKSDTYFCVDKWEVKDDASLENYSRERYEFMSTEITCPPLYYCEESRLHISAFTQLFTQEYRISCPHGTGLHVHIGNAEKGFEKKVLCNLMSVLWIFSDRLDTLHPRSRRVGETSLRADSVLGQSLPNGLMGTKVGLSKLLRLRNHGTINEIVKLTTNEMVGVLDYNLYNLEEILLRWREPKKTIEFRQHEATLDPERVVNWINVCVGLVEFANTVDSDSLDKFLSSHIDDNKDFTVIDLLRAIGRPVEAVFYEKRGLFL